MGHERNEVRKQEGAITRIYREDSEACAEAVRYALEMRGGREEAQPPTGIAESPEEAE